LLCKVRFLNNSYQTHESQTAGQMKVAWYLVNEGADVFTVNKSQQNLLCVLFFNPNPDITLLKYLVSKGVSISQQDTFGEPALHKASRIRSVFVGEWC
jgi:ankyrin repeat protein